LIVSEVASKLGSLNYEPNMRKSSKSTVAKAKANIQAKKLKLKSKLPTGNAHEIHEAVKDNFAINVYEPLDDETYVAPKKCHDAAAP